MSITEIGTVSVSIIRTEEPRGGFMMRKGTWSNRSCRSRMMEDSQGIKILQGSIQPDHVHMLLSCPANLAPSEIMQNLKGKSSKLLQEEFPKLKKKYWGQHIWGRGYFCGTVGEVDQKMIEEYIEKQGKEEGYDNFSIGEE